MDIRLSGAFASANGYSGFRSYFDEIFGIFSFERIFVLKGGPGTGKSTLLRRIGKKYRELGMRCEDFLCSSDPHSLDAVILSNGKRQVAILDGTAPHQTDAKLPGAADCLINLAESVDEHRILPYKKKLEEQFQKKSLLYKKGYEFLSICGAIDSKVKAESKIEGLATAYGELTEPLYGAQKGAVSYRLYHAFGKEGELSVIPPFFSATHKICLIGNPYATRHLMHRIRRLILENAYEATVCPDALDDNFTQHIYLPSLDLLYTTESVKEPTRVFSFPEAEYDAKAELDTFVCGMKKRAQNCFAEAFVEHRRMEEIYGGVIDFSDVDEKREQIDRQIGTILC